MLASPISPPSRRPPFVYLAIFMVFAVLSFHAFFYGGYDTDSIVRYGHGARHAGHGSWLILTMSKASHLQRRHMIRQTWQKLYGGSGLFESRFVIADPGPYWHGLLEQENATYGDIMMLAHEGEGRSWGMTVKTLEAFEALTNPFTNGPQYTFVSRIDEESWLDAKTFHDVWLAPRVKNHTTAGTVIGRKIKAGYPFTYFASQFYTMSWDMVKKAVELWHENYIHDEHEDILLGRLFYEADERYNLTVLPPRVSFEYDEEGEVGDGSAWSSPLYFVDDQENHAIAAGSVHSSKLDRDDIYMKVAACYDEEGVALSDNHIDWSKYMEVVPGWSHQDAISVKYEQ